MSKSLARAAPLAVLVATLWGSIAIAHSLSESLWIDELHSAWSANASFGDIGARAARGNQLSPYFWLLWAISQTFGTAELVWRAPSVCAWMIAVALTGWHLSGLASRCRQPMVLAALALIVCDRAQIFYATEARPYALLSLASLGSWLALASWSQAWFCTPSEKARWSRSFGVAWLAWCGLSVVAFWLQPTALLSITAQYAYLLGLAIVHHFGSEAMSRGSISGESDHQRDAKPSHTACIANPSHIKSLLSRSRAVHSALWPVMVGGTILALAALPALKVLSPVWERRQQWAGFAAGYDIGDVLELLPFTSFLLPLLVGLLLTIAIAAWRQSLRSHLDREWWMWLCAWSLPCCLVYVLTASGAAPLMHRRYVFITAFPFVIWLAHSWPALAGRRLRGCVFIAMMALLLYQQGSLAAWRRGDWPAAVRGEDWRGAVDWINSQSSAELPGVIFCASNLIEGTAPVTDDLDFQRYLTLPLRSIYKLKSPGRLIPLGNDPRTWPETMRARESTNSPASEGTIWLVVRSSAAGLEQRLRMSGLSVGERRDFGGVQVARGAAVDSGFNKSR